MVIHTQILYVIGKNISFLGKKKKKRKERILIKNRICCFNILHIKIANIRFPYCLISQNKLINVLIVVYVNHKLQYLRFNLIDWTY